MYGVSGLMLLGCTPRRGCSATLPSVPTSHPVGILQLGVLEKIREEVGEGLGQVEGAAFGLGADGSTSTNHDLKSARAMAFRVSFIRRFSSILSSSVPRMWAMARCSGSSG
jgi:hypothetical protein